MLQVHYTKQAIKDLKKINEPNKSKIVGKVRQYAAQPESQQNNVKALRGSPYYRLRVGNYRVTFGLSSIVMSIEEVKPRGQAYQ